ncbi:Hypothetical predicted protein [Paramuricea clavata]|uniref:Uncharacterized protein n=2 Tax=Paramuricea clavata TaxID=317549 RepID=A0A6S7H7V0_PARCT|nr:Hypothetical predicted protein [Paramuricea clavata]
MEKYSKPEDKPSLESKSEVEMSEKESERNANFAKEEKTSGNNEKDKNDGSQNERLGECDSEKRMDKSENSENNVGSHSAQKQAKVSCAMIIMLYFLSTLVITFACTVFMCYKYDTDVHALHSFLLQRLKYYYYFYFNSSVPGVKFI